MAITLEGYETTNQKGFYCSYDSETIDDGNGPVIVKKCISLSKIREINEDEVLGYLKRKIDSLEEINQKNPEEFSDLEKLILKLDKTDREEIRTGKFDSFIRRNTPARNFSGKAESYLIVKYGSLKFSLGSSSVLTSDPKSEEYSYDANDCEMEDDWIVNILIRRNRKLASRRTIRTLLNNRTNRSKTLIVSKLDYDPKQLTKILDLVYVALNKEKLRHVRDCTHASLENLAEMPVVNFMQEKEKSLKIFVENCEGLNQKIVDSLHN